MAGPVISADEVRHIAHLARLKLADEEVEWFRLRLTAILEYVAKLNEIDVSNVEPTSHVIEMENVLRNDEVRPSLRQDSVLHAAPATSAGFVVVPRIIETEDRGAA
jgi:aspartyl-tRNA(Asn)/glutamyl-tRNA(Gln) amidotransferase subunit C